MSSWQTFRALLRFELVANPMLFIWTAQIAFMMAPDWLVPPGVPTMEFHIVNGLILMVAPILLLFAVAVFEPGILAQKDSGQDFSELLLSRAVDRRQWFHARTVVFLVFLVVPFGPTGIQALVNPEMVLTTKWSEHERYLDLPGSTVRAGGGSHNPEWARANDGYVDVVIPSGRRFKFLYEAWLLFLVAFGAQAVVLACGPRRPPRWATWAVPVFMMVLVYFGIDASEAFLLAGLLSFVSHWPVMVVALVAVGATVQWLGVRRYQRMEVV